MTLFVDRLTFERNNQPLLNELELSVRPGEVLQIQGTNGSGKSTLLRLLAGLIEPHHGTITWNKQPIQEQLDEYQHQLHYLGHQNAVKPGLTVEENLRVYTALSVANPMNKADLLNQVGLKEMIQTKAQHLSAGQLRRLSLVRLLLHPKPLWLLDEPMTALDATGQQLFLQLLNQHVTKGGMVVLATHQPLLLDYPINTLTLGEQYAQ